MKKIGLMITLVICQATAMSQVTINLVLNPNPPAVLSEWASKPGTITMVVTNIGVIRTVKINSILSDASGVFAGSTIPSRTRSITIPNGVTVLQASDVLPLESMQFVGPYYNSLLKTGKLPQGSYQLCVHLDSVGTNIPVTATQCRNISMVGLQLPTLLAPYEEQYLPVKSAQNAIIFRWTNVLRAGTDIPNYRVEVYEILSGQQPVQAMRSNLPLLNISVKGSTQYIWRPQLLFDDSTVHRFIWTIRTTDSQGNLLAITDGNPEGRSEPKIFNVGILHKVKKKK